MAQVAQVPMFLVVLFSALVSSPDGFITKDQFDPFLVFAKFVFRISEGGVS